MAVSKQSASGETQLRSLIGQFDAKGQKLIRAIRAALRKKFPTANELVYDYGSSLVIAYSPNEHGIEGILSIAARKDGVRLYFGQGKELPDPKKLLLGSGRQTRYLTIESARQLAHPDVAALLRAAIKQAPVAMPVKGGGELIFRTSGSKKRPKAAAKPKRSPSKR